MERINVLRTILFLPLILILVFVGCNNDRADGRQKRLDTFRAVLPVDISTEFDLIENFTDCRRVGLLITEACATDSVLNLALDSIKHAELIDLFTDTELVRFFWLYFANAIETGTVPEL